MLAFFPSSKIVFGAWNIEVKHSKNPMFFGFSGLLLTHIHIYNLGINSQHSMLATSVFQQNYNSMMRLKRGLKKYPTFYVIFSLGNN